MHHSHLTVNFFCFYICDCVNPNHSQKHKHLPQHIGKSENNSAGVSFYYMGSVAQTQIIRLGSKHPYPLSHPCGP